MNIFFLSLIAELCAKYHFNKHVTKIVCETCQLLSTAHWLLQPTVAKDLFERGLIWKSTHANHPCAVWTRAHRNNYIWLASLGLALCAEFEVRFSGAAHKAKETMLFLAANLPDRFECTEVTLHFQPQITMPPQCMPEELRVPNDPVAAYRNYYRNESKQALRWFRPKRLPISFDDRYQYSPQWMGNLALTPPKYFLTALERVAKQAEKKRARDESADGEQKRIAL